MKSSIRLLTLSLMAVTCMTHAADWHVSTQPQQRHALLEEFTGIRCIYCPQGHKIGAQLLETYGEQICVVNVHYGSFAEAPYADMPDFNTECGDQLGNYYQVASFPSAIINRRQHDGSIVANRSDWTDYCEQEMATETPVNLWTSAQYNPESSNLTIVIEGYVRSTDADTQSGINLAVALTQDSILGPQSGGLMADEYPHNHVLRDYLTPVWGEELGIFEADSYWRREYSYTVPTAYKNTEVDPAQLELVCILTNADKEVINAVRTRPQVLVHHVSAEPQPRHAVIEEFTGIFCGNCPDGAAYVSRLQLAQPELVHSIAIHAGHYADTEGNTGLPDFTTSVGDEIFTYYDPGFFPSGMVNRHPSPSDGVVMSRSLWGTQCRDEAQQTAAMNLWSESSYDAATRTLSVDIEGYTQQTGTYALAVALVQNHIKGYQNGAPTGYLHNHVLRAYLTPTWGDELGLQQAGTYCQRHYEYQVPEVIGNVDIVPEELEVVAMVLDPEHTVVNACDCQPQSPDFSLPLLVQLEPYKYMPTRNWGFNFIRTYLVNRGTEAVTEATFDVTLNDETVTTTWQGYAPGRARTEVLLPVNWLQTQDDDYNDYQIVLTHANGEPVTADNEVSGSFSSLIDVTGNVTVKIKEDYHASDNRFRLLDSDGNLLQELGPYPDSTKQVTYEETLYLQPGRIYCFEITDAWGNGIKNPLGSIKFYNEQGTMIVNQNNFEGFGYCVCFRTARQEEGIQQISSDADGTAPARVIWRNGQLIINTTSGAYSLHGLVINY